LLPRADGQLAQSDGQELDLGADLGFFDDDFGFLDDAALGQPDFSSSIPSARRNQFAMRRDSFAAGSSIARQSAIMGAGSFVGGGSDLGIDVGPRDLTAEFDQFDGGFDMPLPDFDHEEKLQVEARNAQRRKVLDALGIAGSVVGADSTPSPAGSRKRKRSSRDRAKFDRRTQLSDAQFQAFLTDTSAIVIERPLKRSLVEHSAKGLKKITHAKMTRLGGITTAASSTPLVDPALLQMFSGLMARAFDAAPTAAERTEISLAMGLSRSGSNLSRESFQYGGDDDIGYDGSDLLSVEQARAARGGNASVSSRRSFLGHFVPENAEDSKLDLGSRRASRLSLGSIGNDFSFDGGMDMSSDNVAGQAPKILTLDSQIPFSQWDLPIEDAMDMDGSTNQVLLSVPITRYTLIFKQILDKAFDDAGPGPGETQSYDSDDNHEASPTITFHETIENSTRGAVNRRDAALSFLQTMVLATANVVQIEQHRPYADIKLARGPRWSMMQTA
jgi:Conserved region of Rad21 / Rec8 like protein